MKRLLLIAIFVLLPATSFAQDKSTDAENSRADEAEQAKSDDSDAEPTKKKLSDDQIAKILIRRSIDSYSGNCPCPYSRASNGSRCGGRSAYSRPGGASPLCFRRDVTATMIVQYRESDLD